MPDADVSALWSYIRTALPVRRKVETNLLPFPYNIRATLALWNWVNFKPQPFAPDPAKSAAWNRGAYLVTGPAHCGTCHTPKSLLGADKNNQALFGASLQGWFAPDITAHRTIGIGGWSQGDIVSFLKTGWNSHGVATGPMAEAVENSTSRMTDTDLNAIAVYLKDQAASPRPSGPALAAGDPRMKAGEAVYQANCVGCHGWDGKGASRLFPPLAGNGVVRQQSMRPPRPRCRPSPGG
jgi:mono/diheme cytochrome c family protein